jgi:hypothetical protein
MNRYISLCIKQCCILSSDMHCDILFTEVGTAEDTEDTCYCYLFCHLLCYCDGLLSNIQNNEHLPVYILLNHQIAASIVTGYVLNGWRCFSNSGKGNVLLIFMSSSPHLVRRECTDLNVFIICSLSLPFLQFLYFIISQIIFFLVLTYIVYAFHCFVVSHVLYFFNSNSVA